MVRPHRRFSAFGASTPLSYVISQRENPLLTLLATGSGASSDPILFAQTVTLHGVLAGGGGQTITLQARSKQGQFATVATTTANSAGQYSFTQAPQENTAYKVLGGGRHSAVLFEGVKYVLTAGVSAGTVQAGQTLTFAGTVTPFREGHVVYLERQNANGGGYHVVDLGTLTAGPGGSGTLLDHPRVLRHGQADPADQGSRRPGERGRGERPLHDRSDALPGRRPAGAPAGTAAG